MKRDKLSFLVLFVEVLAIVFLHSVKNRQPDAEKMATHGKQSPAATYQLNALQVSRLK